MVVQKVEEFVLQNYACAPPEMMVCIRVQNGKTEKNKKQTKPKRKHRARSRELRAGILYMGCDCEKRNGLQDDCRRTGCQGSPECLTKPEPICGPSEFANGKHLGKNSYFSSGKDETSADCDGNKHGFDYVCFPAGVTPPLLPNPIPILPM